MKKKLTIKTWLGLIIIVNVLVLILLFVTIISNSKIIPSVCFAISTFQLILIISFKRLISKDITQLLWIIKNFTNAIWAEFFFRETQSLYVRINNLRTSVNDIIEREREAVGTLADKFYSAKNQSMRDQLTKVFNRRYLEEKVLTLINKRSPFGVIFFDIDFFKKVNDTYGHDIGDEVLKLTTKRVNEAIRPGDLIARYGGEEFVIVADKVSNEGQALSLAERVRNTIAQEPFLIGEGVNLNITISLGATVLLPGDTIDKLFKRADNALYQAKKEGRNKAIYQG